MRDSYVLGALFKSTKVSRKGEVKYDYSLDDWESWRSFLTDGRGADIPTSANIALAAADYEHPVSVLRAIDIVVWMRHQGWRDRRGNLRAGLPAAFLNEPSFVGTWEW